jgi:hypothetical protein
VQDHNSRSNLHCRSGGEIHLRIQTILLLATGAMLTFGSFAVADPAVTPTQVSVASGSDLDAIVCRSEDALTGTRIGRRRICHTNREWADQARNDQDELVKGQIRASEAIISPH